MEKEQPNFGHFLEQGTYPREPFWKSVIKDILEDLGFHKRPLEEKVKQSTQV